MRDFHTFREQFGPEHKRGADVKTVQDASAERTATELLREEQVAAPTTKKSQTKKTLVVWTCTAKSGNHSFTMFMNDRDF